MTDSKWKPFNLKSARADGLGNWGWPSCIVVRLENDDGEWIEATIPVDNWRNATAAYNGQ